MSILDVAHLSHSYGGREIFEDVSFRLEKGEHVALVGANGEGKSTFMSIITGKLSPDDGKITWARRTKVGYMDQHAALEAGKTIRETLRTAFQDLVDEEKEMLAAYDQMESASPDELERLMADTAEIQERLEAADYYNLDTKIEEVRQVLDCVILALSIKSMSFRAVSAQRCFLQSSSFNILISCFWMNRPITWIRDILSGSRAISKIMRMPSSSFPTMCPSLMR
jgi:ATPase subunit of ABC transporter with duplicated ATPase domains